MLEAVTDGDRVVGVRGEGTNLKIPEGIKEIAHGALRERMELETVILPEGCRRIGQHAFFRCENLTRVVLPEKLEEIGTKAFSHCGSLREVTIPAGCRLGEKPFLSCTGLEKIRLGLPAGGMKKDLFYGCTKVQELQTGSGRGSAGEEMPDGNALYLRAYLGIPDADGFLVRESHLLAYFGDDIKVQIPEGVEEIDPRVFKNNRHIEEVKFPDSLRRIGWNAFDSCSALKSVHLPAGVRKIESEAFRQCFALETVRIHSDCTMGRDVFYACRNIREFDVAGSEGIAADFYGIPAEDGFLIRDGELINYWGPTENIRVPETVKKIARGAFNHAFMSFHPLTDHAHIELPAGLEEMQFMRVLRGSQISLSLPEGFLLQEKPLDPDLGEWLATKWSHQMTLREITALYLFQDHSRWPFQLEDELRVHIPQAAAWMLTLLKEREPAEQTAANLEVFLRRWGDEVAPKVQETLMRRLYPDKSVPDISGHEGSGKHKAALPDLSGDRLRIPPRTLGMHASAEMGKSALQDFALLYLSGESVNADYFLKEMISRPEMAAVWQQGTAYFVRIHGAYRTNDGSEYVPTSLPVKVAHSLEMPPRDLDRWRQFFAAKGLTSLIEQLEEPAYTQEDLKTDLFFGLEVPIHVLQELPWWDGLHLYDYRGNNIVLEIDPGAGLALGWKLGQLPYGVIAGGEDPLVLGRLQSASSQLNRRTNRIRYVLDRLTVSQRLAQDDMSLRKFLEGLPPHKALPLVREAARIGAGRLNAVLLESQKLYQDTEKPDLLTLD